LLVPVGTQNALGHGNLDQSFPGPRNVGESITFFTPIGQEFIPTVNNLVAVDLYLQDDGFPTSTITVNIRSGNIGGPILGTTIQTVNIPALPGAFVHFDFPSTVPLTLGNIHVIEVQSTNSVLWWSSNTINLDLYTPGQGITFGVIKIPCCLDFLFKTFFEDVPIGGEIIPISTSSLLLAGVQTNLAWIIPVALSVIGLGVILVRKKF